MWITLFEAASVELIRRVRDEWVPDAQPDPEQEPDGAFQGEGEVRAHDSEAANGGADGQGGGRDGEAEESHHATAFLAALRSVDLCRATSACPSSNRGLAVTPFARSLIVACAQPQAVAIWAWLISPSRWMSAMRDCQFIGNDPTGYPIFDQADIR